MLTRSGGLAAIDSSDWLHDHLFGIEISHSDRLVETLGGAGRRRSGGWVWRASLRTRHRGVEMERGGRSVIAGRERRAEESSPNGGDALSAHPRLPARARPKNGDSRSTKPANAPRTLSTRASGTHGRGSGSWPNAPSPGEVTAAASMSLSRCREGVSATDGS